jgi:hypothetical protein
VLLDLRFSLSRFLNGRLHTIRATKGVGSASVTAKDFNDFLRAHGDPFTVAFEGGHVITKLGGFSAETNITLRVSDGNLELSAGSLPTVSVPLPDLIPGLAYGSARPADGRLILSFGLHRPTLDLRR